jgi:hypothetical protein
MVILFGSHKDIMNKNNDITDIITKKQAKNNILKWMKIKTLIADINRNIPIIKRFFLRSGSEPHRVDKISAIKKPKIKNRA